MISIISTIGNLMTPEQSWGHIYSLGSDAGLVMPFRSFYFRDFFPTAWTDLAIGMIYSNCGAGGDTSSVVDERLVEDKISNLFHFGMSQSVGISVPVADNPLFIGLRGILDGVTQIMTSPLQLAQLSMTLVKDGSTSTDGDLIQLPLAQGAGGTPFNMVGIRFTFDRVNGLVYVNYATDTAFAIPADTDPTILEDFLGGMSNLQADAIATFGISNVTNFKTFYIYWPYLTNKLKLHCLGAVKYG